MAIVRGRIMTSRGRGLGSVRVSHEDNVMAGFTMSRADGHFDFAFNARSGKVALTFGKSPLIFQTKTFRIRSNEVQRTGAKFNRLTKILTKIVKKSPSKRSNRKFKKS